MDEFETMMRREMWHDEEFGYNITRSHTAIQRAADKSRHPSQQTPFSDGTFAEDIIDDEE